MVRRSDPVPNDSKPLKGFVTPAKTAARADFLVADAVQRNWSPQPGFPGDSRAGFYRNGRKLNFSLFFSLLAAYFQYLASKFPKNRNRELIPGNRELISP